MKGNEKLKADRAFYQCLSFKISFLFIEIEKQIF